MEESYSNEGSVKEVSGPTMESIINFIYTSCIILTHDNVYDVLEAAEYLRITSNWYYYSWFFDTCWYDTVDLFVQLCKVWIFILLKYL